MAFHASRADRIKAGLGAAGLQIALGLALVAGLASTMPRPPAEDLKLFGITPPPPPPPPVDPAARHPVKSRREGAASPPNLRAKPTEVVAPVIPPIIPPPPVVVAKVAGIGSQASAGAAAVAGPGSGSGGQGNGTGSGGRGDGDGGGGDTAPRWRKGKIRDSDYPHNGGVGGVVSVRYTVTATGRATECQVTRSSGDTALDATTCRLIEERYRYDPSRTADGTAVSSTVVEDHSWITAERPQGDADR